MVLKHWVSKRQLGVIAKHICNYLILMALGVLNCSLPNPPTHHHVHCGQYPNTRGPDNTSPQKEKAYGSWPCPLEDLKQFKGHTQDTSRMKVKISFRRASGKAISAGRKGRKVEIGDQLGRLRKGSLDTRGKAIE